MSVMATANYNEVYHTVTQPDGTVVPEASKRDPMFHWDTHFPERLSRLTINPEFGTPTTTTSPGSRRTNARNRRNRCAARFKTQPITFDEIKEVDEETVSPKDDVKENLKSQFTVFSRSMDGLVVSPFSKKLKPAGSTGTPSPLTAVSPAPQPQAEAAGGCTKEEEEQKANNKIAQAQAAAIQRQQFRQRRKKRHTKSIEEAPELDRIENLDSTG